MALFVNQNSNRSKLQEKLAAELQEKARQRDASGGGDGSSNGKGMVDGVDDSAYLEGTKRTTSLAWLWATLGVLFAGAVIWLVFVALNR